MNALPCVAANKISTPHHGPIVTHTLASEGPLAFVRLGVDWMERKAGKIGTTLYHRHRSRQNPFAWVRIIIEKLYLKKDVPVVNKMELVRVTKENLGEWARKLKEWGYEDVPEKFIKMK